MHDDFADWYRAAGIEPTADELSARWAGVERYSPGEGDIVTLASFFYGLIKPTDTFLASFRAPFKAADAAFKMVKNDNELRVLAGSALVDEMDRAERELAMLAALCLASTSFQNVRPAPRVSAIANSAGQYLANQSVERAKSESDAEESEDSIPSTSEFSANQADAS